MSHKETLIIWQYWSQNNKASENTLHSERPVTAPLRRLYPLKYSQHFYLITACRDFPWRITWATGWKVLFRLGSKSTESNPWVATTSLNVSRKVYVFVPPAGQSSATQVYSLLTFFSLILQLNDTRPFLNTAWSSSPTCTCTISRLLMPNTKPLFNWCVYRLSFTKWKYWHCCTCSELSGAGKRSFLPPLSF